MYKCLTLYVSLMHWPGVDECCTCLELYVNTHFFSTGIFRRTPYYGKNIRVLICFDVLHDSLYVCTDYFGFKIKVEEKESLSPGRPHSSPRLRSVPVYPSLSKPRPREYPSSRHPSYTHCVYETDKVRRWEFSVSFLPFFLSVQDFTEV